MSGPVPWVRTSSWIVPDCEGMVVCLRDSCRIREKAVGGGWDLSHELMHRAHLYDGDDLEMTVAVLEAGQELVEARWL